MILAIVIASVIFQLFIIISISLRSNSIRISISVAVINTIIVTTTIVTTTIIVIVILAAVCTGIFVMITRAIVAVMFAGTM